ncbi:DNA repair protein RecO [Gleimia hominis]|uniref:DNA repair protein RecO n=1 Tax=Gleimia hominis TaxID=595468 RepID=A0ABU3IAT2_9ACTO|nr:DNA repair protein RecO [Gleimia hominis]MDT3767483.1 DNA repair protein RecO [Gleimia hominis]
MRTYRDEGIVLRTHKLGEADRIITVLTRYSGLKRVVAKGVRRTKSKFGARLEPFTVVDAQFYAGRSLDTLTQVQTLRPYGMRIARDHYLYACANVMVEAAEKLSEDDQSPQMYLLLLGALHALAFRRHDADLVMNSFLLRAFALSGWAPSFYDCAVCGRPGPASGFSVEAGGAVCENCRPPGSLAPSLEALALLGDLISGDWARADEAPRGPRRESAGLVNAWVQYHLERRLKSMDVLRRLREV